MAFHDLPIKRKLVTVILLTSFAVLGLTSSVLLAYELYSYKKTTRRTFSTIGQIIADSSSAVLVYDDAKRASEILSGFRAEPEIAMAALYDARGHLYVSYPADQDLAALPAAPATDGFKFALHHVTFFRPVMEGQKRVGALYIRGDLSGMYRRLGVYGLVLWAVVAASGVLALILSNFFQRLIAEPVLELANTARLVAENRDYSIRAVKLSNDELGGFTEAFNGMLSQIQASHLALRASEERLSAVFQQAGTGIAQTDLTGRFTMVNDRYCEIVGRTREVLLLLRMQDIIHHADIGHHLFLTENSARDASSFVIETRYSRPTGGFVWVRNSIAFICNDQRVVESAIAVTEDITGSKRTEQELERARDEAVAASRAKDDFLAALSHELRTPLNPVLLLASEAAEDKTLPPGIRADFATIRKNVELEARLIDDLLDLTRITRGKLHLEMRPQDVHTILRDALATVQSDLDRKQIVPKLRLNAPNSAVLGDAVRLQQVFWNVLKNAVKFTPERGDLTVETRVGTDTGDLTIEITDTGIGMLPSELERIFEAFSQGDHASTSGLHRFGGVGLGLAISRMLTDLHHGSIRARSVGRGCGSTFVIQLPLDRMDSRAPMPHVAGTAPLLVPLPLNDGDQPTLRGRILLIEDHAPTRLTLQQLLLRRHYEVIAAGSVAEARESLTREHIDFVISDIGLPDGNPYELMSELRDSRGLTGIALTGYGMESDIARSHAAGFVIHLTKPLRVQSLDDALAKVALQLQKH
ncbi:MAG: ATP-binding protein [Opitutus sp.]